MEKRTRKKKLGGFPAVGVILSSTLALMVLGLLGILLVYSFELRRKILDQVKIEVYFSKSLSETQRLQLESRLNALPWVNREAGKVTYTSAEQAAKIFIDKGEDFTEFLGDNPLLPSYAIPFDPLKYSEAQMDSIVSGLTKMSGVVDVNYQGKVILDVKQNFTVIGLVLITFALIMVIAVTALINNSLRLAMFSQRFLIRSMQLVGARPGFIMRPFLQRSAFYGLLSGVLAIFLLWGAVKSGENFIPELAELRNLNLLLMLAGVLVVAGMILAAVSTYFSIRKYLKMSLEDLY